MEGREHPISKFFITPRCLPVPVAAIPFAVQKSFADVVLLRRNECVGPSVNTALSGQPIVVRLGTASAILAITRISAGLPLLFNPSRIWPASLSPNAF